MRVDFEDVSILEQSGINFILKIWVRIVTNNGGRGSLDGSPRKDGYGRMWAIATTARPSKTSEMRSVLVSKSSGVSSGLIHMSYPNATTE